MLKIVDALRTMMWVFWGLGFTLILASPWVGDAHAYFYFGGVACVPLGTACVGVALYLLNRAWTR